MHTKKPLRTVVIYEESDSSDTDFLDTIGFPADIQPVIVKEEVSTIIVDTNAKLETQPLKIEAELSTVKVTENADTQLETEVEQVKEEQSPSTLLVMDDIETECKVEIKIEKEVSIDVFEDTIEMEETDTKIEEFSEIIKDTHGKDVSNEMEKTEVEQQCVKNGMESDSVTKLSDEQKVIDRSSSYYKLFYSWAPIEFFSTGEANLYFGVKCF